MLRIVFTVVLLAATFTVGAVTGRMTYTPPVASIESSQGYAPIIATMQDGTWHPLPDDEEGFIREAKRTANFGDEAVAITQNGRLIAVINPDKR